MSQARSLPDKYYGENGIHRVPMWRLAGFALNNTSTNAYAFLMSYVAYYMLGFVGVATVTASSIAMYMRIWDGVTDPFIGLVVDKTNGKFGKNRPFMVIGNIIMCVTSFILFHVTHRLPESTPIRLTFFIVVELIFYIGYTFQCVVTKSAQSCVSNDPKQRPLFSAFNKIFHMISYMLILAYLVKYLVAKYGSFYEVGVFHELWLGCAALSAVCMVISVIAIAPKDRPEFFGTGKTAKVSLKDYWDTLKHNRAIQMLVVAASSDKLANMMHTSTVTIVLFGVVVGNYGLYATINARIAIVNCIVAVLLISTIATRLGMRKSLIIGSIGGIIVNSLLIALWFFGDPTTMNGGDGVHWGFFAVCYTVLMVLLEGCTGLSGSIVIPMTGDCADYEVYRTGKYVPGLMGTLFSLVDKLISAFGPFMVGLAYAAIGFTDKLPDVDTPYSNKLMVVSVLLMYATSIVGLVLNLIAMKFYPLTKEKMAEIQEEIAAIKAKTIAENA